MELPGILLGSAEGKLLAGLRVELPRCLVGIQCTIVCYMVYYNVLYIDICLLFI